MIVSALFATVTKFDNIRDIETLKNFMNMVYGVRTQTLTLVFLVQVAQEHLRITR